MACDRIRRPTYLVGYRVCQELAQSSGIQATSPVPAAPTSAVVLAPAPAPVVCMVSWESWRRPGGGTEAGAVQTQAKAKIDLGELLRRLVATTF